MEGYVQGTLEKELLFATFREHFKATNLGSINDNIYQYFE